MVVRDGARSFGLDCVRALAISMVVTCHVGLVFAGWCGGHYPDLLAYSGFFGVELFFVLSGFLIGRIVIDLLGAAPGWRAWRIFLVRRWMRTLPVYWATLGLLALVWPPWPGSGPGLMPDLLRFGTLTQNLAWRMTDPWFSVSWSLGVEEWFYVLFASLLFALAWAAGRRVALPVVLAAFLVVPALVRWHITTPAIWDQVVSKMVACRLDAIAFGVVAAWAVGVLRPSLAWRVGMMVAGVGLVAAQWGGWADRLFTSERAYGTFIFDIVSLGFSLCLPLAAGWRTRVGGTWAGGAVAGLSRLAYPLYLTHLSVLELVAFHGGRLGWPGWVRVAVASLGIGLAAWALHRLIEMPFMARRPPQHMRVPA